VSVRPLRLFGDPVLRTACDPVVRFDDVLARLVADLLDTVADPGISAIRSRADHAVVSGVDLRQEPVVVTGTGELARCLQHETDHLRGKLYIDDLTGPERRRVMRHLTALA